MFRAFIGLAVGLARESEFHQLRAHRVGTDRMPHLGQGCGKLLHAFRHPDQRPHRIAQRRRLDQALERRDKPRIVLANRAATTTGTANLPLRQRLCIEILLAAIDRRAGEPGDFRDDHQTASTSAPHLRCRKQAPPPLVQPRADRIPSQPNGGLVGNVIWLVLAGWWLALSHLVTAIGLAVTIVGIPFAWAHLKLASFALWPIGKAIVLTDEIPIRYRW